MSFFDRLRRIFGAGDEATAGNGAGGDGAPAEMEMISCHDALVLVHEYLDGELEDVPQAQVKAHFDVCERCYPHLRLETAFREAVRRASGQQAAPPELRAKIAELMAEVDSED